MSEKTYVAPSVVTRSSAISEEKRARIVVLREEGLTMRVIAERLGLHLNTVHGWLKRFGLIRRRECGCAVLGRRRADCVCRSRRCEDPEEGVLDRCTRGHAYTEQNTGRKTNGSRFCRECKRQHDRERTRSPDYWKRYNTERPLRLQLRAAALAVVYWSRRYAR